MHADTTILLALLMKNEDVWLKIPSQQLFDDVIVAMKLVGLEFATQGGHQIQIISLEGKKKREEEAAKQLTELQAYLARVQNQKQTIRMNQRDFLAKITLDPPDPPKKNSFSDNIKQLMGRSTSGSS